MKPNIKTSHPSLPPLPSLPSQDNSETFSAGNASSHQSMARTLGKFCEKILIVCCVTLFLALLVVALFNKDANADANIRANAHFSKRFSSHNEVKALLLQAIRKKAWSGRYETGRLKTTLPSDFPEKGRLRLHSLLWDEASMRFSARVEITDSHPSRSFAEHNAKHKEATYDGLREQKFSLSGKAIPYVRVLAARRTLFYGTRITRADLKTLELPISKKLRSALTDTRQALGMEIRFRRRAGEILRVRDLRPARLVKRRSVVQVAYNHEGVRVVLQALALNDGAHGETVRLRNKFSGREFSAVVDGAGHAKVTTGMMSQATPDASEEEDFPDKAARRGATSEQNLVTDNPFRARRQLRYDNLLNEPLAGRGG